MMGMDHNQRSNAVGFSPSYLPDGEGARHGGGTYTGNATEPTIQDYENFFGPSARDIKTDLQRFKRHGRWHLPDVLQGPNPWLTDRIDGLITDATNSPFTTKILPYRYKEEVDGKIKWNVWSFDEGMASRVPYESAARTLTQSKRSFAGYMVRQGMAIVLEHNFMMSPKGRENFKNQLNQLIGRIQYTNDLDVHMALILAPSYQKTMRERYYTIDKSASQMCREFADLFGMMQKNVNALDILIEEGKAILRTWGGPMPDFLLCNSKLTFQMTMTPEKTNYITQGIDGVKRLRSGPDLGSYRGLSVIHTRSFAIETGQHPRDMLRRRVRTAEYYRILPDKKNVSREFEFYNEERDTWFTMSFHDLLKCARYVHENDGDNNNASKVDAVYHSLSGAVEKGSADRLSGMHGLSAPMGMLGAYRAAEADAVSLAAMVAQYTHTLANLQTPLMDKFVVTRCNLRMGEPAYAWYNRGLTTDLGITFVRPRDNAVWDTFEAARTAVVPAVNDAPISLCRSLLGVGPLRPNMLNEIYLALKHVPLNNPFRRNTVAAPGSSAWFASYTFYLEVFRRGGLPFEYVEQLTPALVAAGVGAGLSAFQRLSGLRYVPPAGAADITCQFLSLDEAVGSVNHPFHLFAPQTLPNPYFTADHAARLGVAGEYPARRALLTSDVLEMLVTKYSIAGSVISGIDHLCQVFNGSTLGGAAFDASFMQDDQGQFLDNSRNINRGLLSTLRTYFAGVRRAEEGVSPHELLARAGLSTIPMYATSTSHLFHPIVKIKGPGGVTATPLLDSMYAMDTGGQLTLDMLEFMVVHQVALTAETLILGHSHPWFAEPASAFNSPYALAGGAVPPVTPDDLRAFFQILRERITLDPMQKAFIAPAVVVAPFLAVPVANYNPMDCFSEGSMFDQRCVETFVTLAGVAAMLPAVSSITPSVLNVRVDMNQFFDRESLIPFGSTVPRKQDVERVQDVEILVVRPNIEHNMLGVIMGLGGNELGNTLWGQTELSVYDDSMHGIWGMSYKYHERAIVFNEKNLIRMWDIAYDGYNGGKDDTYVDWTDLGDERPNGVKKFKDATLDLSKNYRGPSMMVLAFVHDRAKLDDNGDAVFDRHFRRNWPSPIVFYDTYDENNPQQQREVLPIDYDNVQTVDVEEFRVFNNQLYAGAYRDYRGLMPEFKTLHTTRKTAGQSSADAETGTDCLAFQGSMRIKEGGLTQEIQGSGHHGPDYVGVASVRAGKGQKVSGQAPTPYRIV